MADYELIMVEDVTGDDLSVDFDVPRSEYVSLHTPSAEYCFDLAGLDALIAAFQQARERMTEAGE